MLPFSSNLRKQVNSWPIPLCWMTPSTPAGRTRRVLCGEGDLFFCWKVWVCALKGMRPSALSAGLGSILYGKWDLYPSRKVWLIPAGIESFHSSSRAWLVPTGIGSFHSRWRTWLVPTGFGSFLSSWRAWLVSIMSQAFHFFCRARVHAYVLYCEQGCLLTLEGLVGL